MPYKDPEEQRLYQRGWARRNPEKIKEYSRTYAEKHPERRKESCRLYAQNHPQKIREKVRSYRKARPEVYLAANKRWLDKHPAAKKAQWNFHARIRREKIVRPEYCSACDKKRRVQGHHADYAKPYEVEWVCRKCHKRLPRGINDNISE